METGNKKDCTGCSACASICPVQCIAMIPDEEGFRYPSVDHEACTDCGACKDVCPVGTTSPPQDQPAAYACINRNEQIRRASSSGGLFTLLAEDIIQSGGVVFGAAFNRWFEVEQEYVETRESIGRLRGSKYVQSTIGGTLKETKSFLETGKPVLFSGTPCQIGGLYSFLGSRHENLLSVDIICHGVPSPRVWRKYRKWQESRAGSEIREISFRSKDRGWKRFLLSILFNNATEYRAYHFHDPYMRAFLKNICLRPSCHACTFKTVPRESDITLADFWGIGDLMPDMDDDRGTSLVLVNSAKGRRFLEHIKNDLTIKNADLRKALRYNPSALESAKPHPHRAAFFRTLDDEPFDRLAAMYCKDSVKTRLARKLYNSDLRTLYRIIRPSRRG